MEPGQLKKRLSINLKINEKVQDGVSAEPFPPSDLGCQAAIVTYLGVCTAGRDSLVELLGFGLGLN